MNATRSSAIGGANAAEHISSWRDDISETNLSPPLCMLAGETIGARAKQREIGPLKVSNVQISATHDVVRAGEAVTRGSVQYFNLKYIRRGALRLAHCDREIRLQRGEFVLLDPRKPYRIAAFATSEYHCIRFPMDWLSMWIPNPGSAVAKPIRHHMPWRPALAATIDEVLQYDETTIGNGELCAMQIAGALALALMPPGSAPFSRRRDLLFRIMRTLELRSHEHQLHASRVAADLAISERYLHKVLQRDAATTYARALSRIRLERARAMLSDRNNADVSVSEIGWRCGFCDASHFTKRFHSTYGQPPGAYRRAAGAPVMNSSPVDARSKRQPRLRALEFCP
jgi:AraC-like DNA-binding protein